MALGVYIYMIFYTADLGNISASFFYVSFAAGEVWTTEGAGISESQDDGDAAAGSETKKYNTTG